MYLTSQIHLSCPQWTRFFFISGFAPRLNPFLPPADQPDATRSMWFRWETLQHRRTTLASSWLIYLGRVSTISAPHLRAPGRRRDERNAGSFYQAVSPPPCWHQVKGQRSKPVYPGLESDLIQQWRGKGQTGALQPQEHHPSWGEGGRD